MKCITLLSSTAFHPGLINQLFPTQANSNLACSTPNTLGPGPAVPSHLPSPAQRQVLSSESFSGSGGGARGSRPGRLPQGGGPRLRGRGPPRAQPCGSGTSATHLLSVAGRRSAPGPRGGGGLLARLGHGEAVGSADWKGGPGGERWERGREGVEGLAGAPREAAFPTQPRTRAGALPHPAGPSPSCPPLAVPGL